MDLTPNLSRLDRRVRYALGAALLGVGIVWHARGWWAYALIGLGALTLVSARKGFCHVYRACGVSTLKPVLHEESSGPQGR